MELYLAAFGIQYVVFIFGRALTMEIGKLTDQSNKSTAMGLYIAAMYIGSFIIAFFVAGLGKLGLTNPQQPLIVGAVIMVICLLGWVIYKARNKDVNTIQN
jgi:MFS family permease